MSSRLCTNVQEFIDISCHVNALLHKTSDEMIRKRSIDHLEKSRSGEGCDSDTLINADISNLSYCLQVLNIRKQVCEHIKTLRLLLSKLDGPEYTAKYAAEVETAIPEFEKTLYKAIEVVESQIANLPPSVTDCLTDFDFFPNSNTSSETEEDFPDPLTKDISPLRKTNIALGKKLSELLSSSHYKESDEESERMFYEVENRNAQSSLSPPSIYQDFPIDDDMSECSAPEHSPMEPILEYENPRHSEVFAEDVSVTNPVKIGHGVGSYTVYTCTAKTPRGGSITVKKRYSEFVMLRRLVIKYFKPFKKGIPMLPEKKAVGRFKPEFIEARRKGLEYFMAYILLHPIIGGSPIIRKWFLGQSMSEYS